jgi:hypothetical protein
MMLLMVMVDGLVLLEVVVVLQERRETTRVAPGGLLPWLWPARLRKGKKLRLALEAAAERVDVGHGSSQADRQGYISQSRPAADKKLAINR